MKKFIYATAMLVAVGVSVTGIRNAEGKLVYEEDLRTSQNAQRDPIQDLNSQQAITMPMVQTNLPNQMVEERQQPTKTEMLRRQRTRQELQNEDMLTQKLEELRLQDEMKRTQNLMAMSGVDKTQSAPLTEQPVGTAAQELKTQPAVNPMTNQTQVPVAQTTATVAVANPEEEGQGRISITPRGGMTGITNSMYDVQSDYTMGLGIGVDFSENLAFTAGYTYSKYTIAAGNTVYNPGYALQKLDMSDNVFDAGLRVNFLSSKAKLRPFIGAGVGYRRGYVNYDDATINMMRNYSYGGMNTQTQDVELSAFMGYIETGLEVKLTKMLSLNGMIRYFNILSSRQTNPINPYAFVNPYNNAGGYGANGTYGYNNDARTSAGNALADNNFYQMMLGLSVSF